MQLKKAYGKRLLRKRRRKYPLKIGGYRGLIKAISAFSEIRW